MNRFEKYLLFSLVVASLSGCTLEQKLALQFAETGVKDEFILMEPEFLFKYNLKTYEFPGLDTLPEPVKDSILLANSLFLKNISDSLFIRKYASAFIKTIETYGINIYPESYLDTFMASGREAYIIHIAQFSLEEYVHPYETEEEINYEIVVIDDIDLNALNYNVWIELSMMNAEGRQKVFFASDFLLDRLDGILRQYLFTGENKFEYTIDTITNSRIYSQAQKFGEKTAGYLYDYFLNSYIDENLPKDYQFERYYYHYDPLEKKIYPVEPENSLIELKK